MFSTYQYLKENEEWITRYEDFLIEDSNKSLISQVDKALYFHVGKTQFNTGIKIELLQDFVLVSLDTFKKYRYSDIREGRIKITGYDMTVVSIMMNLYLRR